MLHARLDRPKNRCFSKFERIFKIFLIKAERQDVPWTIKYKESENYMEYSKRGNRREYFKVVLVRVSADEYVILKGPEEEKFLARMLKDDYNSTRYEKMIQLLAEEVVPEEYRAQFYAVFSMENMLKVFREGEDAIEFSYPRKIGGKMKRVTTRVYPRLRKEGKLEEFMVYVLCHEEGCRCVTGNAEGNKELS